MIDFYLKVLERTQRGKPIFPCYSMVSFMASFTRSSRAVRLLDENGILVGQEVGQTRQVLSAAALTYVAAAAASILQLLRLLILFGNRRDE